MFWLLAFLAVAGTLAYRATPLPTATGVLGVTVLFYGWLGDSAGRFLLLALIWLFVFVPLNVAALRQEWFSRPLLGRWLTQRPTTSAAPLPELGSAAPLLEGMTALPMSPAGTETPDAPLRAEALAAALMARLRRPLHPAQPQLAQARVAETLYLDAALVAQAPRLLAQEQPDSGLLARSALAWPLAKQTAVLHGLAPEASLDWAATSPDLILMPRLATAHGAARELDQSAQLDSPAARLIAFDAACWPLLGRLLGGLVRSFAGSFVAIWPTPREDAAQRRQQWLTLAGQRLAVLMDLRPLLQLFGAVSPAYEQALARALLPLLGAQAAQAWHVAAGQPGSESALMESLLRRELHRMQLAIAEALRELPHPAWRLALRALLMPLPMTRPPNQAESLAAATALLREPTLRARLRAGLPSQDALLALDDRLEALRALEPSLRRLQQVQIDPPPADDAALLAAAIRLGLLSEAEQVTLSEALEFAADEAAPPSKENVQ